jgi:hypothetical protein
MELAIFAHFYVCPMDLQVELLDSSTGRLSWNPVIGATYYNLYRSTQPYVSPSAFPWQTVTPPTTYLEFTDGIGDQNTNYYFMGRAGNNEQLSSDSNIVGEFDFGMDIP